MFLFMDTSLREQAYDGCAHKQKRRTFVRRLLLIALRGEDDSGGGCSRCINASQIALIYNNLQKDDRLSLSQAVVNCIKRLC